MTMPFLLKNRMVTTTKHSLRALPLRPFVTTPHGEIQGLLARAERNVPARGSFAKAPSEPTVSSISVGGLWALDLRHRLVHQTFDTLVFLPKRTI